MSVLSSSCGYSYLLTCMDWTSHWLEVINLSSNTADSCAHAFMCDWVTQFRVPCDISSNRGFQFTSSLWTSLASSLGVTHQVTMTYHPQGDRLVKCFHCSLKASLCAGLSSQTGWRNCLGCLLVSDACPSSTSTQPLQSWCLAIPLCSLGNSSAGPPAFPLY